MKKIICLLLSVLMLASLCACGEAEVVTETVEVEVPVIPDEYADLIGAIEAGDYDTASEMVNAMRPEDEAQEPAEPEAEKAPLLYTPNDIISAGILERDRPVLDWADEMKDIIEEGNGECRLILPGGAVTFRVKDSLFTSFTVGYSNYYFKFQSEETGEPCPMNEWTITFNYAGDAVKSITCENEYGYREVMTISASRGSVRDVNLREVDSDGGSKTEQAAFDTVVYFSIFSCIIKENKIHMSSAVPGGDANYTLAFSFSPVPCGDGVRLCGLSVGYSPAFRFSLIPSGSGFANPQEFTVSIGSVYRDSDVNGFINYDAYDGPEGFITYDIKERTARFYDTCDVYRLEYNYDLDGKFLYGYCMRRIDSDGCYDKIYY